MLRETGLWSTRIRTRGLADDARAHVQAFSPSRGEEDEGERAALLSHPRLRFSHFLDALIPLTD